ncbi:TfoX/Sxy family protein [Cyanobium sp. ATX 6F1]|uniref:TfoX/Sxy family protein n=1 Tax=unclassified Cyanobium TaxID=2627006 RepID=UPI0020CDC42D|nr:TfoX/Sxy family protein [Cyanobium sp. ATX 6F1]
MATDPDTVTYICEQVNLPGELTQRKMFGEYALYLAGKVVALVCDNDLYVKPTAAGRQILGTPVELPPYPGAKPYFRVRDEIETPAALQQLLVATAQELPLPKPKTKLQTKLS